LAISTWKLRACAAIATGSLCLAAWAQTTTSSASPDSSRKFALLIGIDVYQPAGTQAVKPAGAPAEGRWAGGLSFPNLKGPTHDVEAMRALLTSQKYGVPNDDAHIQVLLNGQATHDAMLTAMRKVLVTDRKAGDTVVLYVSSHGSLRVNTKGTGAQFEVDGKAVPLENSLVPADGYKGVDDIYSSQLRRIYGDAANKGVRLTVIIDACHSGSLGRGAGDHGLVPRMIDYDPRDLAPEEVDDPDASRPAPESLPVNPVLVISAAQKDQSAMDVQDATPPHGLFTQALVEALEAMPASAPALDVFRRVIVDMEINGSVNQQPALDSTLERKREPLFGGTAVTGELRASVVSTEEGTILLDTGLAADIGPGSTFIALVPDSHGVRTVLKVTGSEGVTRSDAVIVLPANGKVKPADIFVRQVWVPAPLPKVKFYLGPGGLSQVQIADALAAVKQSGAVLAADPTGVTWTHLLSWNGKGWLLEKHLPARDLHAHRPAEQQLGAVLRAADLKRLLPAGSVVWLDASLPDELRPRVLQDKQASVESALREQAAYVVGAVPTEDGIAYTWIERDAEDVELRTPQGMGAGCSPDLPMPLRTDAVPVPLAGPISEDTVAALNQKARDIARLSSWLHLESSTDAESFPYSLGVRFQ
jgi:hypothetical protein